MTEREQTRTQVYAGGRKAELLSLMRAYRAHQVTRREFSQRMRVVFSALPLMKVRPDAYCVRGGSTRICPAMEG